MFKKILICAIIFAPLSANAGVGPNNTYEAEGVGNGPCSILFSENRIERGNAITWVQGFQTAIQATTNGIVSLNDTKYGRRDDRDALFFSGVVGRYCLSEYQKGRTDLTLSNAALEVALIRFAEIKKNSY